ncbi:MAG: helix-turn-helix transcriptional regulator [Lawsonibacter sp.]|nr:helix-turn-helix transcriptional regulator [Lawsonibacter sp.]
MGLPIDAMLGERIRFYRQQAGLTQKELAGRCEVSESAIRNYELGNRVPDFLTLHAIAEKLRVNYAAIAGEKVTDLEGALQALYKLEEIYGLYPTEVDGQIHFVFRDSVAVDKFKPDMDTVMGSPGVLLQYRVLGFMKACALHDAGELTDEEYALWKSKFPAFLSDFYDFRKQAGKPDSEAFDGDAPVPSEKPQSPERSRERKINSGR